MTSLAHIPESDAKRGEKGTFISASGGIGLCYRLAGRVWISGGNGFYYEALYSTRFVPDDGKGYRMAIAGLALPPAYQPTT